MFIDVEPEKCLDVSRQNVSSRNEKLLTEARKVSARIWKQWESNPARKGSLPAVPGGFQEAFERAAAQQRARPMQDFLDGFGAMTLPASDDKSAENTGDQVLGYTLSSSSMRPYFVNSDERGALRKPLMDEMEQQSESLCENLPQPAMMGDAADQLDAAQSSSSVIGQMENGAANGGRD